jgi:hypothetical protein
MADISIGYALLLAGFPDMEPDFPEPIQHFWQRL